MSSDIILSVVIPAFNHPGGLCDCLDALANQAMPSSQFEVIVVDDGSEPPLAQFTRPFEQRLQLTYLRVPNGGPATARNHGAQRAQGRFLAFTDHDCVPAPQWLYALRSAFAARPGHMLGGPKLNGLPGNLCSTAHHISSRYVEQHMASKADGWQYFSTNNLAVPRERFLQLGGFNERLPFAHEDREWGARWAADGGATLWVADAVVEHRHVLTLGGFLRQHFRYGTGAADYHAERHRAQAKSLRFAGLKYHAGLVTAPFADGEPHPVALTALLVAAQAAYLTGALSRFARHAVAG